MARVFRDISLGERLARVRRPGVALTEVTYGRGVEMPPHAHANPNVTLVLEGGFAERVEGRTYDVEPGCVVVKPAGTVHANAFDGRPARSFLIELREDAPAPLRRLLDRCRWLSVGVGSAAALPVYAAFRAMTEADVSADDARVDAALAALFAALARGAPQPARPVGWDRDARALLDADALSIGDVAGRMHTHRAHFTRRFRQRVGVTPREYRQRRRLGRALQLLAATDLDLATVADRAGYCDQSHLCRALAGRLGFSPARYRALVGRAG